MCILHPKTFDCSSWLDLHLLNLLFPSFFWDIHLWNFLEKEHMWEVTLLNAYILGSVFILLSNYMIGCWKDFFQNFCSCTHLMQDRANSPRGGWGGLKPSTERKEDSWWSLRKNSDTWQSQSKGKLIREGVTLYRQCGLLSEAGNERA